MRKLKASKRFEDRAKLICTILLAVAVTYFVTSYMIVRSYPTVSDDYAKLLVFRLVIDLLASAAAYGACLAAVNRDADSSFFVLLALGLGLLYAFVITPLSPPDEETHYRAAYQLSNMLMGRKNVLEGRASDFDFSGWLVHYNSPYAYLRLTEDMFSAADNTSVAFEEALSTIYALVYLPEYLPQALGITAARILRLGSTATFLLGRLFNLAFFVLCLSLALGRCREYDMILAFTALLPISLQQAASYSYDSFVIGLSILLTACLLQQIYKHERFSGRDFIRVLIPAMLLAPAKGVYALLLFLFLLIPAERFESRKKKADAFLGLLCACLVFAAVVLFSSVRNMLSSDRAAQTLAVAEAAESSIFGIVGKTFIQLIPAWVLQSVGISLSGLTLDLPVWIVLCIIAMLFLSVSAVPADGLPRLSGRIVSVAVPLAAILCFIMSMHYFWDLTGNETVTGVQGRYLTPLVPCFFDVAANSLMTGNKVRSRILPAAWAVLSAGVIVFIVDYTIGL